MTRQSVKRYMITWRFLRSAAIFVATCATSAGTEVCAAEQRSDFYGSIRIGPAFVEDMNFSDSTTADLGLNPKAGWSAGGALGYRFFDALRMECDLAYTANKLNGAFQQNVQTFAPCGEFPGTPCLDPTVDGDIYMLTGFAMTYYDFPLIGQIRPYVGLGVGFVDINLDVGTSATLNDGPVSRFAIIDGSDTVIGYRGSLGLHTQSAPPILRSGTLILLPIAQPLMDQAPWCLSVLTGRSIITP